MVSQDRAFVEVSCSAIRDNLIQIQSWLGAVKVAPVVKSEAYGHGLLKVAEIVAEQTIWGCCVVSVAEGIRLREAGFQKRIVVVGPSFFREVMDIVDYDLEVSLYTREQLKSYSILGNRTVKVHLKVDTGLGRLAYPPAQFLDFMQEACAHSNLEILGLYSHLADAEGLDQSYTQTQFHQFQAIRSRLESLLCHEVECHIAASAAGILLEPLRQSFVRVGIALYGFWPSQETKILALGRQEDLGKKISQDMTSGESQNIQGLLRPALSFKSQVVQVKEVAAGCSVGYGCTYEAKRPMKVAVVPVGYAEGVDRGLSNQGEFLIRGKRCPIVGRVCMNMTTLDVTDLPEVCFGDEVVLIGRQGKAQVTAEDWASWLGTIHYEVVTRIPLEVSRLYVD